MTHSIERHGGRRMVLQVLCVTLSVSHCLRWDLGCWNERIITGHAGGRNSPISEGSPHQHGARLDKFWNGQYNIREFRNERFKIARPKAFDRDKAKLQALQLFWRKGYAATSIEDLVETLGLSRSSLYDTFGDKHSLYLEALQAYSERVTAAVARTLHDAATPLDGLRAIFDELAAGAGGPAGEMGCFMVNSIAELAPHDPEVARIAAAYGQAVERLLAEALEQASARSEVRQDQPPEALAAFLYNAIQGLKVVIKAGASREEAQAIGAITLSAVR